MKILVTNTNKHANDKNYFHIKNSKKYQPDL